jgi:hypothetical protein
MTGSLQQFDIVLAIAKRQAIGSSDRQLIQHQLQRVALGYTGAITSRQLSAER